MKLPPPTAPRRPIIGRALFYHRDSEASSELAPKQYVEWALRDALAKGVAMDCKADDITTMIKTGVPAQDPLFIDYGTSGNILSRPGFDAFREMAITDMSVTHVFVPRRDRIARPDDPADGFKMELQLRQNGISIVFMNGQTLGPIQRGRRIEMADLVTGMIEYHQSGEFRRDLAMKLIAVKTQLARMGCSIGGEPPYGFRRWLCDAQLNPVRELQFKERVKIPGHHVFWLPDEVELAIVRRILEMIKTLPVGRIARILTEEGIPSPMAGRMRRRDKVVRPVSGVWHPNTVREIATHPVLIGMMEYGRRASGDQLRFTPTGHRELEVNDFDPLTEKPREIVVPEADRVRTAHPMLSAPVLTGRERAGIVAITEARGRHLKGIPRHRLGNFNPLGARIFDMNCGWPMYRIVRRERWYYCCGLYQACMTKGCEHHTVDGEEGIGFSIDAVRAYLQRPGVQEELRQRLESLARDRTLDQQRDNERSLLLRQQETLKENIRTATGNLALAKSAVSFAAVETTLAKFTSELTDVEAKIASTPVAPVIDSAAEVEAALAVLERLPELIEKKVFDEAAVEKLIGILDLRLYFRFKTERIGKSKRNSVISGILTLGNVPPPCPLYDGPTDRNVVRKMLASGQSVSPILGNGSSGASGSEQNVDWSRNQQRLTRQSRVTRD